MNTADSSINAASEPRSGTSNTNTASAAAPSVDTIPSAKYGSSLPTRISTTEAGVDITASIVPRSHSRSEEHTSELQSLMRISYAVFCLKKKNITNVTQTTLTQ